jgi:hypothetical protein
MKIIEMDYRYLFTSSTDYRIKIWKSNQQLCDYNINVSFFVILAPITLSMGSKLCITEQNQRQNHDCVESYSNNI